jgi:hypothetical protein
MTQAKEFLEIAARCRRLAATSRDVELAAELKGIADELTSKADEFAQNPAEPAGDQLGAWRMAGAAAE